MKESFINWRPTAATRELLVHVNTILDQYHSDGYILTLRQLYYQLVAKGIIPNNTKQYTKLSNMEQVRTWKLPENPAKTTDSRYQKYVNRYGTSSWELDALNPQVLSSIVNVHILNYLDSKLFDQVEQIEQNHKNKMREMISKI